jgi:hypothetical protein
MEDLLTGAFAFITLRSVLLGVLIFIITFSVNLAIVSIILVKIPATYFQKNHSREFWKSRSPAIRLLGVVLKNALGVLLVAIGIVLSLPGVPGQGLLTILLGIMLLDFPGRRKLETKLLSKPAILNTINKLRHKFGKPALVLD